MGVAVETELPQARDIGLDHLAAQRADGTLRTNETVYDGLEQAPAAFLGVLPGADTGKMPVRLG
ncbi:hypothetical protein OHB12_22550 [Nocardia sp. NBC_01730]|uniref:hypothetical protein n=1 Tax=Nocardia sp. NBC_01730 TaxID=2975998 RepID=UPI002E0F50F9|nr:hypothetical protein OHB12_22550 [Nocardia sp. NBC_01730]